MSNIMKIFLNINLNPPRGDHFLFQDYFQVCQLNFKIRRLLAESSEDWANRLTIFDQQQQGRSDTFGSDGKSLSVVMAMLMKVP